MWLLERKVREIEMYLPLMLYFTHTEGFVKLCQQ